MMITVFRFSTKMLSAITRLGAPIVQLFSRCWVAWAFLSAGVLKVVNWNAAVTFFQHNQILPAIPYTVMAGATATIEILLASLLIIGLGGRLVSILLFLYNLFVFILYPSLLTPMGLPTLENHVAWGIILAFLISFGPGTFSMDYLLEKLYQQKNKLDHTLEVETSEK